MSSDPTPPPPGDNSLASWEKYEEKAVEKDKEADREAIDKMIELQKQFASPSKLPDPPTAESPSPLAGDQPQSPPSVPVAAELPSESGPSLPPPSPVSPPIPGGGSLLPSEVVPVVPPPPPASKKATVLRKMSSKPEVSEADRKRIRSELQQTGPSRVELLALANKVGNPPESWWKDHAPIHELVRLHPEWPRWWIVERQREGWLKKPRGGKVEASESKAGPSRVPSKAKGKRKARSEEEEESSEESSSSDADSDPDAVVEVIGRPTKRPRTATTHEFRPYSKPPGPTPLPGRPIIKPAPPKASKVREVFVLVPPLTNLQAPTSSSLNAVPSKSKVPLFAPSETSEVVLVSPPPSNPAPKLVLDPKSPLNIRIPPRLPRLPSPPTATSLRRPSPDLETRNQVFEGTQFSSGDVLRGRLADARRQSLVFGRGLKQFTTHASAWSLQLESFRREFRERGFEPSPMSTRFFDNAIEESRRMALYWGDVLNEGDCEHMRSVTAGVGVPSQQDLIDKMDKEGMDARWEQ
ncbi:hypothetical protein H0H93_004294 [Arthromyces matolae]|nr:hypothetical protein H0H93_004294 [Arthromyces matolae]